MASMRGSSGWVTPVVLCGFSTRTVPVVGSVEIVEMEAAAERIDLEDRVGDRAAHGEDVGAGKNERRVRVADRDVAVVAALGHVVANARGEPARKRPARQAAAARHPDVARQLGLADAQRVLHLGDVGLGARQLVVAIEQGEHAGQDRDRENQRHQGLDQRESAARPSARRAHRPAPWQGGSVLVIDHARS